ncbi:MAG: hypothetical protein ACLFVT_06670, partial [Syntrophobacteria bacterium]
MVSRAFILLVTVLLAGCGSQQPGDSQVSAGADSIPKAASIRMVRILPEKPTSSDTLETDVLFQRESAQKLSYQWLKNGTPIPGAIKPTLRSEFFHKGDFIWVQVRVIRPGGDTTPVSSESVVIGNTPPVVDWVAIEPNPATSSELLKATATGRDKDNDQVHFVYQWKVNGENVIGQKEPFLERRYFRRGDKVQVVAIPLDGDDRGTAKTSPVLAIQNSAPKIVSAPPERLEDGTLYRYKVEAEDVDDDPLRFYLEGKPPAGMKIDEKAGVIEWKVEIPEEAVTHEYQVVAEDPEGAR